MASVEDRQSVGFLRQLTVLAKTFRGAREPAQILMRGLGSRDTGVINSAVKPDLLILSIYSMKEVGEKAAKTAAAKTDITIKVQGFLTEDEPYLVVSETVSKEGQHSIALPNAMSAQYKVSVECGENIEYAVFAL